MKDNVNETRPRGHFCRLGVPLWAAYTKKCMYQRRGTGGSEVASRSINYEGAACGRRRPCPRGEKVMSGFQHIRGLRRIFRALACMIRARSKNLNIQSVLTATTINEGQHMGYMIRPFHEQTQQRRCSDGPHLRPTNMDRE